MDVALDGGEDDLALGFDDLAGGFHGALFGLHEGVRWATAFFMTRADLTTCGRNILPAPKRSPTTDMPAIRGPSMTRRGRPSLEAGFFGVDFDVGVDAADEGVREAFFDGAVAPGFGFLLGDDGRG